MLIDLLEDGAFESEEAVDKQCGKRVTGPRTRESYICNLPSGHQGHHADVVDYEGPCAIWDDDRDTDFMDRPEDLRSIRSTLESVVKTLQAMLQVLTRL